MKKLLPIAGLTAIVLSVATSPLFAESPAIKVDMYKVNKEGLSNGIGYVIFEEKSDGLVITPQLHDLSKGLHGFHVHENPSCEPKNKDGEITPAGAAGSHFDPQQAKHHAAPWSDGHLGDLPALFVDNSGKAVHPVFAPKLHLKDIDKHALVIHKNGDNYADKPKPLGGGGPRIACGIIANKTPAKK